MKSKALIPVLIMLAVVGTTVSAQDLDRESFSFYLVGTFVRNESGETELRIVNPTRNKLAILIGFYNAQGGFLFNIRNSILPPRALWTVNVTKAFNDAKVDYKGEGAIRILSLNPDNLKELKLGIVGFLTQYSMKEKVRLWSTSSNLAAVPTWVVTTELKEKELKDLLWE